MEESSFGGPLKEVIFENTYITEPDGYGEGVKFQRHKVLQVRSFFCTKTVYVRESVIKYLLRYGTGFK